MRVKMCGMRTAAAACAAEAASGAHVLLPCSARVRFGATQGGCSPSLAAFDKSAVLH